MSPSGSSGTRGAAGVIAAAAGTLIAGSAWGQPYAGEMARWTAQDALDPLGSGRVLFIGSSSIRRWEQLAADFADYRIIQRGFGGALFQDVNLWIDTIVLPYEPRAIVVWAGTNDASAGESGASIFADYQAFVSRVHAAQPGVEILYLGIMPTPSNASRIPEIDIANGLIASAAASDPRLHYVDLPAYFNSLNPPSGADFLALWVDPVHLNRAGYREWTRIIRPALESVVAPDRVAAPNPLTPAPGARLLFDFGPSNPEDGAPTTGRDANGNIWNNWHPATGNIAINAGEHIGGLVDSAGVATGIRLTITGGFLSNGKRNGGLASPSPALLGDLAVATATVDYFFFGADDRPGGGNDDVPGGFMLEGLDPGLVYDFRFFGSRTTAEQVRETEYRVSGANEGVAVLRTTGPDIGVDGVYDGNDSVIAEVRGIVPDAFGQVFVDLTVRAGVFGYLNAMEVRVASAAIGGDPADAIVPAGGELGFAVPVSGSLAGAELEWQRDGERLADDGRVSGSATPALTISPARAADAGRYRLVLRAGGEAMASGEAIGAVRLPARGIADLNADGRRDIFDIIAYFAAFAG